MTGRGELGTNSVGFGMKKISSWGKACGGLGILHGCIFASVVSPADTKEDIVAFAEVELLWVCDEEMIIVM